MTLPELIIWNKGFKELSFKVFPISGFKIEGLYVCMYVCITLFKVGQIYINVNKKHLVLQ